MNDRPIVIVGCPRSGTTLLSAMLHAHPRIAVAPETRFLIGTYRDRRQLGDLRDADNRRRLAERITRPREARFRDLDINRARVIDAIVSGPPTLGSAFAAVWSTFARSRGKARWGEKRPAYWREPEMLLRLFPDVQIVHVMRDARSCVASMVEAPWWEHGFNHALATWLLAERQLRHFRARVPADTYHLLRYEDLLADPAGTLERLCEFLGEQFAPQMLDHSVAAADIVPGRKVWHARAHGRLDPARVAAWRSRLTAAQVGVVERLGRRALDEYDYPPSDAGERPRPDHLATAAGWVARTAATLAYDQARERLTRLREPNPVAAVPVGRA